MIISADGRVNLILRSSFQQCHLMKGTSLICQGSEDGDSRVHPGQEKER